MDHLKINAIIGKVAKISNNYNLVESCNNQNIFKKKNRNGGEKSLKLYPGKKNSKNYFKLMRF